ncbi:MAG: hypothetical protein R2817_00350 [Flavobacteriales bacterium]
MRSSIHPLAVILGLLAIAPAIHAQQLLFTEDFEGPTPTFLLNASVAGSSAAGDNRWLINAQYTGGEGTIDCLGFPFTFTIPPTASQPAGITSPGGNYMHIASQAGLNSNISNCNFAAADGFCTQPANHFAAMTTDVNTSTASEVALSFWWLCGGSAANYGEVWYSTNSGSTWSLLSDGAGQYRNSSTWSEQVITSTTLAGHTTLRIGFRFVNGTALSASDPAFGVDDVRIEALAQEELVLNTGAPATLQACAGSTFAIPYTASGPWQNGNVFTAELSGADGTFDAPVELGSITSTSSGAIQATVPAGTVSGTYFVRIRSSAPVQTTDPLNIVLIVEAPAFAGNDTAVTLCKNSGGYALLDLVNNADPCGTWTSPNGLPVSSIFNSATDPAGVYTYTTNCGVLCPADVAALTIILQDPANAGNDVTVPLCSDAPPSTLLPFLSGAQLTGIFFYNGSVFPQPDLTVPGSYTLDYVVYGVGPCPNDTAGMELLVNQAADAGTSTTLTLCANDDPVSLISLLNGAQTTGSWTDPFNAPFSGVLVPAQASSGLYTYTVVGAAPCTNDEAFVAVVIDPCLSVEEQDAQVARWLGAEQGLQRFVLPPDARHLNVYNTAGQWVSVQWEGGGDLRSFGAQLLPAGTYMLTFEHHGLRQIVRFVQTP